MDIQDAIARMQSRAAELRAQGDGIRASFGFTTSETEDQRSDG